MSIIIIIIILSWWQKHKLRIVFVYLAWELIIKHDRVSEHWNKNDKRTEHSQKDYMRYLLLIPYHLPYKWNLINKTNKLVK